MTQTPHDSYNLSRFLDAQENGITLKRPRAGFTEGIPYRKALRELKNGHKKSEWIWYVFPQRLEDFPDPEHISNTSHIFALKDNKEVEQYASHPILGARLIECLHVLEQLPSDNILYIMGACVNVHKLQSCLHAFLEATLPKNTHTLIKKVLRKYKL